MSISDGHFLYKKTSKESPTDWDLKDFSADLTVKDVA